MSDFEPIVHKLAVATLVAMVVVGGVIAFTGDGRTAAQASPSVSSAVLSTPNAISPLPETLTPVLIAKASVVGPVSVSSRLNYSLETVADGDARVPRVFITNVPQELQSVEETKTRKALFLKSVLPLVLRANQEIAKDREKLLALRVKNKAEKPFSGAERLWLKVMAERYKMDKPNINRLLARVDVVPPSLALAQAAKESGWGTSRFAQEGNALFGQWTWADGQDGLVPENRQDGKTHRVRAFDDMMASVRAYIRNLNSHAAYREFRAERSKLRRSGANIDGITLAKTLHRYSELGTEYTDRLKAMIQFNDLHLLDDAELAERQKPSI